MDWVHHFDELSLRVGDDDVGLFSGAFSMATDSDGDAYVEMIILDTIDGGMLKLKPAADSIFKGVLFAMLVAAIELKYRDVLDAYADQFERPAKAKALGYGHLQKERL